MLGVFLDKEEKQQGKLNMKKKFLNFNVFFKHFITYFSIVIIFGIVLFCVYGTTHSIIKNETIKNDTQQMTRNIEDINAKIEKITVLSDLIPNIPSFIMLSQIEGELPADKYYYIMNLQNEINSLRQQYDFDIQVSVIYKNNDVFVSNLRSSDNYNSIPENTYYNSIFLYKLRTQAFSGKHGMRFLSGTELAENHTATAITCVVSGETNVSDEYAIVFNIDLQPLLTTFNIDLSNNKSFLQIVDPQGKVLLNYNYNGPAISAQDISARECNISGEKYSLIVSKTYYKHLDIVQGINNKVFDDKVSSIMIIIKWYIFFAILFSLIAAFYFAYKHFFAIYRLFSVVKENSDLPFQKDELKYVENSFIQAVNSSADYRREIQEQKGLIYNTLLEKLFLYGIYDENEKSELSKLLSLPIDCYAVVTINLDIQSNNALEQCQVIFSHIKDHISSEWRFLSVTNGLGELIILLYVDKPSEENALKIYNFMHAMVGSVIEIFGRQIKVGISNIDYGVSNAHTSYLQTLHAIRQINSDFTLPVNVFLQQKNIYSTPLENLNLEQQLPAFITAGSTDDIKELFKKIKHMLQGFPFPDEQSIMQLFFDIRTPIQRTANSILYETEAITLANYHSDLSIETLLNNLEENSICLADISLSHKKSKNWLLKESMLSYLAEEYTNPALNAAFVAEKFSLSEKYIFAFVKEHTGKPFGKYIESLRLDKVVELLKTTDTNVNEIAQQVGFSSISTFYKTFNRVFGVSPAEWRKNHLS